MRASHAYSEFEPTEPPDSSNGNGATGRFPLHSDSRTVGELDLDDTTPMIHKLKGLSCGHDWGAPGTSQRPFDYMRTIREAVDVEGALIEEGAARQKPAELGRVDDRAGPTRRG